MKNLFDVENYPDLEPDELVAGYRWAWTRSDISAVYPDDSYTLKYKLSRLSDPEAEHDITAVAQNGVHTVEVEHTSTIEYQPGQYEWRAYIVRSSDSAEVHVESGYLQVLASLEEFDDEAAWVYQVLTAIRATIKGSASHDQQSIEVAGRSIGRRSLAELTEMEGTFANRWAQIKANRAKKSGRSVDSRVLVTMRA